MEEMDGLKNSVGFDLPFMWCLSSDETGSQHLDETGREDHPGRAEARTPRPSRRKLVGGEMSERDRIRRLMSADASQLARLRLPKL